MFEMITHLYLNIGKGRKRKEGERNEATTRNGRGGGASETVGGGGKAETGGDRERSSGGA